VVGFGELLVDWLRVLGLDYLLIMVICYNVVIWLGEVGDVEGVLVGFEELLVD